MTQNNCFVDLEITCTGLPEINKFGHYDPTDCTNQKVTHGSNCTLICDPGFEVKGPTVKTCGGKKSGVWSNRSKLPKCVGKPFHRRKIEFFFRLDPKQARHKFILIFLDVTPPIIVCPNSFSVPMLEDDDFAIVKIFPAPNVTGARSNVLEKFRM